MRQKRFPLLLDSRYPPERQILEAISGVPEGERAGFMRTLILLGHQQITKESACASQLLNERRNDDDTGTN